MKGRTNVPRCVEVSCECGESRLIMVGISGHFSFDLINSKCDTCETEMKQRLAGLES